MFIAHGRADPVIAVAFARRARDIIEQAGLPTEYHETDVVHTIDPAMIGPAVAWLEGTIE